MHLVRRALALAAGLAVSASALAQADWPNRPVKFIVTFTQGGAADLTARILGERLTDVWKQQVIVENRGGGNGTIGVEAAMRSPADGYTYLLLANTHVINMAVHAKLPYDLFRDFAPVLMTTTAPLLFAVNPRMKASNVPELTAELRAKPGKIDVVSCGIATAHHFALEMYKVATKTFAVHIPQRGCSPAVVDVVGGVVDVAVVSLPAGLPFIRQGKLKAIAITGRERSPNAPEIPTMRETGKELAGYELENYYGLLAPVGTNAEIIRKVEADVRRVMAMPEVQKRLSGAGMDPFILPPDRMVATMRADVDKFKQIAKAANIQAE